MTYRILDTHTGEYVGGSYTNRQRARRRADTLDNTYGAYRYAVVTLYPTEP